MAAGSGWSNSSLEDVRPYTITGGRTRSKHPLHLTTCLMTRPAAHQVLLNPESEALLLHCSGAPRSVAEIPATAPLSAAPPAPVRTASRTPVQGPPRARCGCDLARPAAPRTVYDASSSARHQTPRR